MRGLLVRGSLLRRPAPAFFLRLAQLNYHQTQSFATCAAAVSAAGTSAAFFATAAAGLVACSAGSDNDDVENAAAAANASGDSVNSTTTETQPNDDGCNAATAIGAPLRRGNAFVEYRIGESVGEGAYAKVHRARHRMSGRPVAVKIIDKDGLDPSVVEQEVAMMKMARRHENIVEFIDAIDMPKLAVIVMELVVGGELFDLIVEHGALTEDHASRLLAGAASAVSHLHARGITHGDIKPENLLVDERSEGRAVGLKLVDFGHAYPFTLPSNSGGQEEAEKQAKEAANAGSSVSGGDADSEPGGVPIDVTANATIMTTSIDEEVQRVADASGPCIDAQGSAKQRGVARTAAAPHDATADSDGAAAILAARPSTARHEGHEGHEGGEPAKIDATSALRLASAKDTSLINGVRVEDNDIGATVLPALSLVEVGNKVQGAMSETGTAEVVCGDNSGGSCGEEISNLTKDAAVAATPEITPPAAAASLAAKPTTAGGAVTPDILRVLAERFDGTVAYWPPEVIALEADSVRCTSPAAGSGRSGAWAPTATTTDAVAAAAAAVAAAAPVAAPAAAVAAPTDTDDDGNDILGQPQRGGPAGDMWALGCVAFIMLCESHPFDPTGESTDEETMRRAIEGVGAWADSEQWRALSPAARDLISGLLERDPSKRMAAAEMLRHPFLTRATK